jgi:hypothetical protein
MQTPEITLKSLKYYQVITKSKFFTTDAIGPPSIVPYYPDEFIATLYLIHETPEVAKQICKKLDSERHITAEGRFYLYLALLNIDEGQAEEYGKSLAKRYRKVTVQFGCERNTDTVNRVVESLWNFRKRHVAESLRLAWKREQRKQKKSPPRKPRVKD